MLFFETRIQILSFLFSILVGILLGLFLDREFTWGFCGFLCDLFLVLSAAFVLAGFVIFIGKEAIDAFHILGFSVGVWIYSRGLGQIRVFLRRRKIQKEGVDMINDE